MSDQRVAPTLGVLLGLAWPIIVSRSTQVVVGMSDALMIAPLGKQALAATTTGAFNTFAILIFPFGICFIVASFASQLFGKGDRAGARRYGWYGLGVAAVAQLLCFLALPFVGSILGLLDYEPEVHRLMTSYLVTRLATGGAAIGLEALANYYGGIGNTRLPMLANVLAMVLNVTLNALLIFGLMGFPEWGVFGAAVASALSTAIAFAVLFGVFLYQGRANGEPWIPVLRRREFNRMLRFGTPSGVNWFFEFFAFNLFINVVVAGLGTSALAAMMSVFQINSVAFMPAFGLASAGAILVGQAIGAGRKDDVPGILKRTMAVACGWQGLAGLFYLFVPTLLFTPFAKGDMDLLAVGVRMLMLSSAWQLFDAMVNTTAESLRAAGDTTFTMWARILIAWGVFFPGSWVTVRVFGYGDIAAVGWVVGYMGILCAVLLWRFRSGAWRNVQLVEAGLLADPPAAPSQVTG